MHLTDQQLASFQELYKKEFGRDITKAEALEKASSLLRFVILCATPVNEKPTD
jgi:hypothetical protein